MKNHLNIIISHNFSVAYVVVIKPSKSRTLCDTRVFYNERPPAPHLTWKLKDQLTSAVSESVFSHTVIPTAHDRTTARPFSLSAACVRAMCANMNSINTLSKYCKYILFYSYSHTLKLIYQRKMHFVKYYKIQFRKKVLTSINIYFIKYICWLIYLFQI